MLYINKLKQRANLIVKQLLKNITIAGKKKTLVRKPKLKKRPQKIVITKIILLADLLIKLEADVDNVKQCKKEIISMIKTGSKIYELKSYDEAIKNFIFGRHQ